MKRIILLCLCASVLLLGACKGGGVNLSSAMDAGSDAYKAATISDADAQKDAKAAAAAMDKKNKVAPAGSAYAKRLAKITKGMQHEDGLNLNFKVYQTSSVNAFAMPDGTIRVYSGLMDLMSDDELFFVIGHEIGHVKLGHSLNAMKVALAASAARKGASAAGGVAGALSNSQLGEIGEAVLNAQFSQSQESDSDAYGLGLVKKYNKPKAAGPAALRKLATPGQEGGGMLSSHPDPMKRAERLEGMN